MQDGHGQISFVNLEIPTLNFANFRLWMMGRLRGGILYLLLILDNNGLDVLL
jgi:hypothetical protein